MAAGAVTDAQLLAPENGLGDDAEAFGLQGTGRDGDEAHALSDQGVVELAVGEAILDSGGEGRGLLLKQPLAFRPPVLHVL